MSKPATERDCGASPGDAGPCMDCGALIHRYGPGGSTRCRACDPAVSRRSGCRSCGAEPTRPYINARLCQGCAPSYAPAPDRPTPQRPSEARRGATGHSEDIVYATRWRRLQLLPDLLAGRPGQELPAPVGGMRVEPRPCSWCRQLAVTTTTRGRSVHTCCEGWLDTLTESALVDLTWLICDTLPIAEVTER